MCINKNLPEGTKVVWCMPNTPVVVRSGVTVYSGNGTVDRGDKEVIEHMLGSVGLGMEMPEHYMDIITGLTGCGPSYVSGWVFRRMLSMQDMWDM